VDRRFVKDNYIFAEVNFQGRIITEEFFGYLAGGAHKVAAVFGRLFPPARVVGDKYKAYVAVLLYVINGVVVNNGRFNRIRRAAVVDKPLLQ